MRTRPFMAMALAGAVGVATGWIGATQTRSANAAAPAPEAADGTLGMALMSAIVNRDGVLVGGAGVVSVQFDLDKMRYEVAFERDLSGCAYVATVGEPDKDAWDGYATTTRDITLGGKGVSVATILNGNLSKLPFHLIVFCTK